MKYPLVTAALFRCVFAPVIALHLTGCLAALPFDEDAWQERVEATRVEDLYAHNRDPRGRFFNPWDRQQKTGFWRWVASRNSVAGLHERAWQTPTVVNDGAYLAEPANSYSITHIGHATFAVHWDGQVVLTDPFFSDWAAVVRRIVPPALGPEQIPDGAIVVISHNHYDHLDKHSIQSLAGKAQFLCPSGIGDLLRGWGARQVTELNWWESVEIGGTEFTFLPTQHWSRRLGQGYNETLWGSWLLQRNGTSVYFGGDSGYFKGYREFGRKYPKIDVALLPIGAYEPRWFMHYAHVNIPEVLQAAADIGAAMLIPTQWGVLELGDEPAAWPAEELRQALQTTHREMASRVRILAVGERLVLEGAVRSAVRVQP